MPTPHILLQGQVEFSREQELDAYVPLAKNKAHPEALKAMDGTCIVWLVEYGQFMTTEQVAACPPHPEAIFGNGLELRHVIWRLGYSLKERIVVALDEALMIRPGGSRGGDAPYVQSFHEEALFSYASGKPYWRADALFLFIGATL